MIYRLEISLTLSRSHHNKVKFKMELVKKIKTPKKEVREEVLWMNPCNKSSAFRYGTINLARL